MFTDFFDTSVGPKNEKESYEKIAEKIKANLKLRDDELKLKDDEEFKLDEILFLTDMPQGKLMSFSENPEMLLLMSVKGCQDH